LIVGLLQILGTLLHAPFETVVGLFHPGFCMFPGGDIVGDHNGMGNLTAVVPIRIVGDLIAPQFPAVELEPVFGAGHLPGKTVV
jgi:hypothetical protein